MGLPVIICGGMMSEETVEVNPYATQRNEKSAMSVEKFCDIETPDAIPPWGSLFRSICQG
ncbi:hypothetical protein C5Y96_08945 [Blastopirellula marina]|uniref:Uncharacterized protein n=1 Tax=Blastopirellula marina TaxID=124 RepID=A0A2S8FUB4_9BACT|nr:hypothetical protein C5Y96_08945 [Blastopirellula marina]RCS53343.1 hypothetical protein DTL36_08955 [Bremerella cremea]